MKSIVRSLAVAAAVSGFCAFAQEIEDVDDEETSASAESSEEDVAIDIGGQLHRPKVEPQHFYTLPKVHRLVGVAEVLKPGYAEWAQAEEGRFYPLGTQFRTVGKESRMTVQLGRESSVVVGGDASFGTRQQGLEEKSRAIVLSGGVIGVKLPRNLPEGLLTVTAPGFSVVNPAGESRYRYRKTGDGDRADVRCVTGSLAVEGRHFKILSMRAANEVCIQTSEDLLFTGIYGTRGDYVCKLDQGLVKVTDVETQASHIEPKYLEWKISPQTAVRIQRAVPRLGKDMSVSVMTFDAAGNLKNRCAFAEKRSNVNSGELVVTTTAIKDADRKASESEAEATEAVEVAAPAKKDDAEGGEASDDGEDKKEKKDDSDDI